MTQAATQTAFAALETLRNALAAVQGVQTCKIGLEANMTPADYPMVRIVPSRVTDGSVINRRSVECLVYFGRPIHEFDAGLEDLYRQLFDMEAALVDAAEGAAYAVYRETILDEDRIDGYKLMAIRLMVEG
jgi:hypothetical protein